MNQFQSLIFSLNYYTSGELIPEDLETVLKVLLGCGDLNIEEFSFLEPQAT